jgi:hypothetical protein
LRWRSSRRAGSSAPASQRSFSSPVLKETENAWTSCIRRRRRNLVVDSIGSLLPPRESDVVSTAGLPPASVSILTSGLLGSRWAGNARHGLILVLTAVMSVTATGCLVGPKYESLVMKLPAQSSEVNSNCRYQFVNSQTTASG